MSDQTSPDVMRLVSYESFLSRLAVTNIGGARFIEVSEGDLQSFLRHFLRLIPFDRAKYLEINTDLAAGLASGTIKIDAHTHFVQHGFFERRRLDKDFVYGDFNDVANRELPEDYYTALRAASRAIRQNKHRLAKELLTKLAETHKPEGRAVRMFARCYERLGEMRRAYEILSQTPLPRLSIDDLLALSSICRALQFNEDAGQYLEIAASRSGDDASRFSRLIATSYQTLGNLYGAKQIYLKIDVDLLGGDGAAAKVRAIEQFQGARSQLKILISQERSGAITLSGRIVMIWELARIGFVKLARRRLNTALRTLRTGDRLPDDIAYYFTEAARLCLGPKGALKMITLIDEELKGIPQNLKEARLLYEIHDYDLSLRRVASIPRFEMTSEAFRCAVDSTLMLGRSKEAFGICAEWRQRFPEAAGREAITMKVMFDLGVIRDFEIDTTRVEAATKRHVEFSQIPQQIVQYWNTEQAPDDVTAAMANWKTNNPTFQYHRFNDANAANLLAVTFDLDVKAAFDSCIHPAMKADYFRLGFLLAFGGFYIDADERSVTPLVDALQGLEHKSLIVVRNPWMSLFNSPLISSPNHRLIARAFELATKAILSKRGGTANPDLWRSTGPGVITSVFIDAILDGDGLEDVAILSHYDSALFSREETFEYKASPDGNWRLA